MFGDRHAGLSAQENCTLRTYWRRNDINAKRRTYLRADDRHRQLLEATARVCEREGLLGVTMVAVAEEAHASRRLVYDHFRDLPTLYESFFEDRASRYLESSERVVADAGGDPVALITGTFRHLLTISTDDTRALRILVADAGPADLDGVRDRLRTRVLTRWLPRLEERGIDRALASAVVWTLLSAFLTLADQVNRGEITADQGVALAATLATNLNRQSATP